MASADVRFTAENAAILLIDHQVGTLSWCHSEVPQDRIVKNTRALARAAKVLGMPLVLTSSQETNAQGPLIKDLEEIAPEEHAARVQRTGIVNCWEDPNYHAAVMKAVGGRRNLIIAGLTNDVCTIYPTISAIKEGFNVQVVADAGGSPTPISDRLSLDRMQRAGATITCTNTLLAELAVDWSGPHGSKLIQILFEEIMAPPMKAEE